MDLSELPEECGRGGEAEHPGAAHTGKIWVILVDISHHFLA